MRKRTRLFILVFLPGILTIISSCTPESCLEETEAFLKSSFYSYTNPQEALPPDSLTVYGLGRDTSLVYSAAPAVRIARLPLNPAAPSSVFVFRINGVTDTLSLYHYSYPHLISRECGYTYYHNLDSLSFTMNAIDSIWIRNGVITTLDNENIQVFY